MTYVVVKDYGIGRKWMVVVCVMVLVCTLQVAVGRVHQPLLASGAQDAARFGRTILPQSIDFISKHTSDGKFVFIDQR